MISESGATLQQGELFLGVGGSTEVATSHAGVNNFGVFAKYGVCNWLSLDFSPSVYVNDPGYSLNQSRVGVGATFRLFDLGLLKSSMTASFSHMTAFIPDGTEFQVSSAPISLNIGLYPIKHFGVFFDLLVDPFWGFQPSDSSAASAIVPPYLTVIASMIGGLAIDLEKVKLRISMGYPIQESGYGPTVKIPIRSDVCFEYFPSLNIDVMVRVRHK